MKKHRTMIPLLVMLLGIILPLAWMPGCTKDKTPVPLEPCDPTKVYFQRDVFPIINSNCAKSGCHDAASHAEGLNLGSYAGVLSIVKRGKPSSSELMKVLDQGGEERMPPPPDAPLTADQRYIISRWISDGALNSGCITDTAACVTSPASYSATVQPILRVNCTGCHSAGSPSGGVDLSSYAGVRSVAVSGKLYKSVSQSDGAVAMPPSGRLSDCDIKKIKAWVDGGAASN